MTKLTNRVCAGLFAIFFCAYLTQTHPARAEEAQAKPSVAAPPATKFVLLGTGGGPLIRLNRSRPATLLSVDGSNYMIDVGLGSLGRLVEAGFSAQDIDGVFISHHHLDHNGGLADLINYSSFGQRGRTVNIIGPKGTIAMVDASIRYIDTAKRIFGSEGLVSASEPRDIFIARDIEELGVIYQDDKITVTAVENSHFETMQAGTPSYGLDRSFSYRIQTPGGVIVFTGDTGPSAALEKLAAGADYLIAEVIDLPSTMKLAESMEFSKEKISRIEEHMRLEHLTPDELGKMAKRAGVKTVVLTHFSPGLDDEDSEALYVRGIQEFYSGRVIAGRDLMEISLPSSRP